MAWIASSCCRGVSPSSLRVVTLASSWDFRWEATHHEEFVEVVAEDGAELGLLQQRGMLVEGLGQHLVLKVDQAQFPIDVQLRGNNSVSSWRSGPFWHVGTAR